MTYDQIDDGRPDRGSGGPAVDILSGGTGSVDLGPRRAPGWVIAVAAVAVAALVAGVAYGVQLLSGGGQQPEDALPAGAIAFVKVDLDPPAGQKLDAARFLATFPALRDEFGDGADLRKGLFRAVASDAGLDLDFDAMVDPWLGHRIGVAVYPPRGGGAGPLGQGGPMMEPDVVVALQITDQGKAEAGLQNLLRRTGGSVGMVIEGGYALLAPTQQAAEAAASRAADGSLAASPTFAADVAGQPDGVALAWSDADAASDALGPLAMLGLGLGGFPAASGSGRSTMVLRFDGPHALELTGRVTDAPALAGLHDPVKGLADLPASSDVAVGVSDGADLVRAQYAEAERSSRQGSTPGGASWEDMVASTERQLGLELPDDLAVLFGTNLVAAVDTGGDTVKFGAKVTTDGDRAVAALDQLQRAARRAGEDIELTYRQTDDGVVVGTSPRVAASMREDGDLGSDEAFRRALPDLDDAGFALWLDLRELVAGLEDGTVDADLAPIDGVGVTAVSDGAGSATFRVRLVIS